MVELRVAQARDAAMPTLSARIIKLSNKGRRINYYDGVTFEANISAAGEVTAYSFSDGIPRYQPLIQAAGPANHSNIFWMPRFPDKPIKTGDTFTHTISLGGSGMEADGQTVFKLEEVRESLARLRLRYAGSTTSGAVGGTQTSEGSAVFDLSKGMWSSLELSREGTAQLAGALSEHYKIAEISAKFSRTRRRVTTLSGTAICLVHAIIFTAKQGCGTTCRVISFPSGCLSPERQKRI